MLQNTKNFIIVDGLNEDRCFKKINKIFKILISLGGIKDEL